MTLQYKVLKKEYPNKHEIVLYRAFDEEEGLLDVFEVMTPEDSFEFDNIKDAEECFLKQVTLFLDMPNWEAQEEHDSFFGGELPQYPDIL